MVLGPSFLIMFFFIIRDSSGLSMERLEVPSLAQLFQPLTMACRYRLGNLRLESVKWYKDDDEFYRFTPSERPQTRKFNISGIEMNMKQSDMHVVSLLNVSISSAGMYRCEVSSDSPAFETVQESGRMEVFYQPDKKPRLVLKETEIQSNENIAAECVTSKSYPAQKIFWFLNGIQVNKQCIKNESTTSDDYGLLTTHSWLSVRVRGGPGQILMACVGSQGPGFFPERTHEELTLMKNVDNAPMTQGAAANYMVKDVERYLTLGCIYAVIALIR